MRFKNSRYDFLLLAMIPALDVLSLLLMNYFLPITSNSMPVSYYLRRSAINLIAGYALMLICSRLNIVFLRNHIGKVYLLFLAVFAYYLICRHRYNHVFTLYHGNFAMPIFLCLYALFLYKWKSEGESGLHKCTYMLIFQVILFCSFLGCYFTGSWMLSTFTCYIMLVAALYREDFGIESSLTKLGYVLLPSLATSYLLLRILYSAQTDYFVYDYRIERIRAFLFPEQYENTTGYFLLKLRELCSEASFFGNGDLGFLSKWNGCYSDYIATILLSYWGIGALIAFVTILTVFYIRVFKTVRSISNPSARLLGLGIGLYLCFNTVYYLGMNLGFLPSGAAYLPFISYGRYASTLCHALIGVLFAAKGAPCEVPEKEQNKKSPETAETQVLRTS